MRRFKNILLVVQGLKAEAAVLNRAVALASAHNAKITIVDVVKRVPEDFPAREVGLSSAKLQELLIRTRQEELQSLLDSAEPLEIRPSVQVLVGTDFLEIVRAVLRDSYDLVIKGAEGPMGHRGQLFGSIDMHLMRKCPCPVWIIKPGQRRRFARILAAVDLEPLDESAKLNNNIVQLALSIAQQEGSEMHVAHAWSLFGENLLRGWRADADIAKVVRQTRSFYKQELDNLLCQFDFDNVTLRTHLLKGPPEEVLPKLANRENIELVVMGTVARVGVSGFLIGNTAEKVLSQIYSSVLTLKPPGFVTPVRLTD